VVRNFMPECLLYQAFQIVAIASQPLVGALEYSDSVGQLKGLKNTAMRQRAAFIQSQKRSARRDSPRLQQRRCRLILYHYRYVIHSASESRRNVAQRSFHNLIEVGRRHSLFLPGAGPFEILVTKCG
jgi:hypothetical protein